MQCIGREVSLVSSPGTVLQSFFDLRDLGNYEGYRSSVLQECPSLSLDLLSVSSWLDLGYTLLAGIT